MNLWIPGRFIQIDSVSDWQVPNSISLVIESKCERNMGWNRRNAWSGWNLSARAQRGSTVLGPSLQSHRKLKQLPIMEPWLLIKTGSLSVHKLKAISSRVISARSVYCFPETGRWSVSSRCTPSIWYRVWRTGIKLARQTDSARLVGMSKRVNRRSLRLCAASESPGHRKKQTGKTGLSKRSKWLTNAWGKTSLWWQLTRFDIRI